MKNIWVVLKKEYLTRIRNKTFIVMTFLAPILVALFYAGAIYFAVNGGDDNAQKDIYFEAEYWEANPSDLNFDNFKFHQATNATEAILKNIDENPNIAWLHIEDQDIRFLDSAELVTGSGFSVKHVSQIDGHIKNKIHETLLQKNGISETTLESTQVQGEITTFELDDKGDVTGNNAGLKSIIGFILAFVIYMFIFIYGSMVMRSAMEEKTNRIVEVIVSSVKPFQLMMGKILGVALVGLSQFIAWVLLTTGFLTVIGQLLKQPQNLNEATVTKGKEAIEILQGLHALPIGEILTIFVLFFLGGYLLYSSIFAAIGSAVNQETDVQQFMLPVSLPLVFGFIIAQSVVFQAPNGHLAQVFSMIPLTSPVVMAVRAPFDVPISEVVGSFLILVITFIAMVWVSGKIYRIGILMYGKKPSWKDLFKWIRQS
jgi:ABC-2 type transport system permease protein